MKILQLGKFYPIRGGVEKVMYDLMTGLSAMGVHCDMLCAACEKEEVGDRGTLFKAVAVVAFFGAVTQGDHELCDADIGGTGKGGNAVIAVKGAVIEGLGMCGLSPVELIIGFQLLHIGNGGSGAVGTLGVIGDAGIGEGNSKIDGAQDQLDGHETGQGVGTDAAALGDFLMIGDDLLFIRFFWPFQQDREDQHAQIQ